MPDSTPDMFATQSLAEGLLAKTTSSPYEPTLRLVRRPLFEAAQKDGTLCPCCHQFVKVYRRKFNSAMGLALIHIYKDRLANPTLDPDGGWVHVEKLLAKNKAPTGCRGDFHKLRHFGLIEQKPETREDGSNRNGYWRITDRGRYFVEQQCKVPAYAIYYNGELLALDGGNVGIREVLGRKFNYEGLMKNA